MNKNVLILIVLTLMVLIGAFCWFIWRPNEIRKNCQFAASHPLENVGLFSTSQESLTTEERYKECLKEHGLEK